jgi:hypothetical protein
MSQGWIGDPVAGRRTVLASVRPTPCWRLVAKATLTAGGGSPGCQNQIPGTDKRPTDRGCLPHRLRQKGSVCSLPLKDDPGRTPEGK